MATKTKIDDIKIIKDTDVSYDDEDYTNDDDDDYVDEGNGEDDDLSFEADDEEDYDAIVADSNNDDNVINLAVNRGGAINYNFRIIKKDDEGKRNVDDRNTNVSQSKKGEKSSKSIILMVIIVILLAIIGFITLSPPPSSSQRSDNNDYDEPIGFENTEEMITRQTLVEAARQDPITLRKMLQIKPDSILEVDENGWNLLHEASRSGNIDCVREILDVANTVLQQFDLYLNARTEDNGPNALFYAKAFEHKEIVELLKSKGGVLLDSRDEAEVETETPVQEEAVAEPVSQTEVEIETPVQEEAVAEPVSQTEVETETPVQEEAVAEPVSQTEVETETPVQLEAVAEPMNQTNHYEVSHDEAVEVNEEDEVEVAAQTFTYQDAAVAAHNDHELLLKILTKHPEFLDHVDQNGWTLLQEASRGGNLECVTIILEMKDDLDYVNFRNLSGGNALSLAKIAENQLIIEMLKAQGAYESNPDSDMNDGQREGEIIQDQSNDIEENVNTSINEESNHKTQTTYTQADAVHAAQVHDPSRLLDILDKHPEFVTIADENGWMLLHEATRAGNVACVDIVLEFMQNKVDINVSTFGGANAMWYAKNLGHEHLVELFELRGGVESPPLERTEL